ncbi:hypothetical protein T552_02705 [Pneumocystis carinii B80]|uniref:Vacuolar protein sorting-associated protein 55 n=1 Tax=Pneumocystis carinii (strain B80) TaxID=1408658 RepID=A0A0W4ZEA5_PNEC8|nr:hypothetical protein T552_02705 [Pneumocystis carinii B80]KTW26699.1 hypothetical protein T552_02705 [Pneumocystis carinii B80]
MSFHRIYSVKQEVKEVLKKTVIIYILAPLPNAICSRMSDIHDFINDSLGNGVENIGRFITGILIVSGIALPITLEHVGLIVRHATIMSISGGLLIYITIIIYSNIFMKDNAEF